MIIGNENSIYIYYEVIEQIEANSILDIGMFLKRVGNVSRCAMECKISAQVKLDGVDIFPEVNLPVWQQSYDNIVEYGVFEEQATCGNYDLAVLLGIDGIQDRIEAEKIISKLQASVHYLLVDDLAYVKPFLKEEWNVQELKVEEDIYYLVDFFLSDPKEIAFIICANNETLFEECKFYIDRLKVPLGYKIDVISIGDAKSMCSAYNYGMKQSTAKYKIYMHQDVFIRNERFLYHILHIFQEDENVGMIGMMGGTMMPKTGVAYRAWNVGLVDCRDPDMSYYLLGRKIIEQDVEVEAIDGLLMATQYDLPWREDLCKHFDFYDVTQSFEMRKAGYKVVVPYQETPWVIHDSSFAKLTHYDEARLLCLKEYPEFFYGDNGFEFEYSKQWDVLSAELAGQIKQMMEAGQWNVVATIVAQYRAMGRKESVLELLSVMSDIMEQETEAGEKELFFEGLTTWQEMYKKYMQVRFLLRRLELRLPEETCVEFFGAMQAKNISYSALQILIIRAVADKKTCVERLIQHCEKCGVDGYVSNLKVVYEQVKEKELPYAYTREKES